MFGFVPPCSQSRRQWFYKELQSHETVGCALLQQRIFFEGNILFWFVLWSDIRGEIVSFQNLLMQHIDSEAEDLIQPNRGSDDGVVLGKLGWILCHLSRLSGRILGRIFCETELIKLKCPQSQCQSVHCYQFKFSRFLSAQMDNWQFQRFSAMTWNALGIEIISAVFCVNMFLKWTKNSLIMWGIEAQILLIRPRYWQELHNEFIFILYFQNGKLKNGIL